MKTIGRDKWPGWVKQVVGKKKAIEIKEQNGRYYAYKYTSIWDKKKKRPTRTSKYLGVVRQTGIQTPYEASLRGIYEYGHVRFVWHVLEENGILGSLKKIFPDDWKVLLVFAVNRLIDPRPIKSIGSWYEKTYLVKKLETGVSPKKTSRVLETAGMSWKSQREFFKALKRDGEKIIYDGSVIFSSSKDNPLLETGYNKEHLLLTKANIVVAFSHDRFFPIFLRVIPGSIHEIATMDVLLEELGEDIILVIDKGLGSDDVRRRLKKAAFVTPLKRNSTMIKYDLELGSFFIYRKRPIKYTCYQHGRFFIYLYEDIALRAEEEKTYFLLLSKGKKVEFEEEWAGKIAIISNRKFSPKDVYEMWKSRDQIEKLFDVLQNMLDVDRPYVRREETFRGYLFASFIGLIAYYLILSMLKKADINDKVSVSDLLLELSKIYRIELGRKEILSERSKRVRKLMKTLGIKNLITKNGWS
jgi:transposase